MPYLTHTHTHTQTHFSLFSLPSRSSYEFKFIAVRDGKYVRWQDGSNRLINIPTTVPSDCGFVAFVPWEGETSVSTEGDTLEEDALDSLTALQLKVVEDMDSSPQFTRAKIEELRDMASNEEESISEANSRAVRGFCSAFSKENFA